MMVRSKGYVQNVYDARVSTSSILLAVIFFVIGISLFAHGHPNGAAVVILFGVLTTALGLLPMLPIANRFLTAAVIIGLMLVVIVVAQSVINSAISEISAWFKEVVGSLTP